MAAALDDVLALHDGDLVGVSHGGQPVGHDHGRAPDAQLLERGLDALLGHGVERGGRLVEDQDLRVFQKDAGDGDALLLPAGEHHAALAHIAVVALGQRHDLVVDLGAPGGLDDLLVGRLRAAVADIFADRVGKEEHVLLQYADIAPQARLCDAAHVFAIHQHRAVRHLIKAGQQLAERGFAAAGGPDEGERFAGLQLQIDVAEHRDAVGVGEAHVAVFDLAAHVAELLCVRRVLDVRLGAHDLQKAGKARRALHVLLGKLRKLAHRGNEGGDIKREGDEVHRVHASGHDEQATHRDDQHLHDAGGELHPAHKQAHRLVVFDLRALEHVVGAVEFAALLLLVGEGLGHAHAGDAALDGGGDLGGLALDFDVGALHTKPLAEREPKADRQRDRQHQCQFPAQHEHHDQRAHDGQRADDDVLRAVVAQLRDIEQLARDAAHQHARAVLVVEAEGELLHMFKEVAPHLGLDQHAHAVAEDGDDVVQQRLGQIGQRHHAHHQEKHGVELLRQVAAHRAARHIGENQIDHRHQQRTDHVDREQLFLPRDVADEDLQRLVVVVHANFSLSATAMASQRLLNSFSACPLTQ